MKDFVINSFVEFTKFNLDFRLEFHCVVSEEMDIPQHIKEKFGINNGIMLALNHFNDDEIKFDFKTQMISWNTTFNHVPFRISIPVKDVQVIVDANTGNATQFHIKSEQTSQVEPQPMNNQPQEDKQKPELKLVVDNSDNYNKTKPTAKLKLVQTEQNEILQES